MTHVHVIFTGLVALLTSRVTGPRVAVLVDASAPSLGIRWRDEAIVEKGRASAHTRVTNELGAPRCVPLVQY
jgi:hypothetical protein